MKNYTKKERWFGPHEIHGWLLTGDCQAAQVGIRGPRLPVLLAGANSKFLGQPWIFSGRQVKGGGRWGLDSTGHMVLRSHVWYFAQFFINQDRCLVEKVLRGAWLELVKKRIFVRISKVWSGWLSHWELSDRFLASDFRRQNNEGKKNKQLCLRFSD